MFQSTSDGVVSNYIVSRKYKPVSQVNKRSEAPRLHCTAHIMSLSERGMLDHYHAWSGHCLQLHCCLEPTLVVGRDQFVFFGGLRGGEIGSWKPANPSTDSSAQTREGTLRQTERSSSHASDLPRCGVKPCQIVVLCFDASSFQNSRRHHVGNHAWHSQRRRHVGPAPAHKPLESMSVFEQTLLDQTGQESLVRYLGKKQMPHENKTQSKTKLTACAEMH